MTDTRTGALGMTFQYDVEGRLSQAYQTNAPSQAAIYAYDAQDRLASRTVNGTTTLYVHDTSDHIIAETDTTGATLREYVWLNDLLVAVVDNTNTASPTLYYVHADHLGRPARMVAQGGSWVWDVIYSPFGGVSAIWDSTSKMDIRFPGQWFQLESSLAYNWHRHYDATLGRYLQPDPIGYAGGNSLHGYAGQSPLAYVDPYGLWSWSQFTGAFGYWRGFFDAPSDFLRNYNDMRQAWWRGQTSTFIARRTAKLQNEALAAKMLRA